MEQILTFFIKKIMTIFRKKPKPIIDELEKAFEEKLISEKELLQLRAERAEFLYKEFLKSEKK
jgi:hypothetical protein